MYVELPCQYRTTQKIEELGRYDMSLVKLKMVDD